MNTHIEELLWREILSALGLQGGMLVAVEENDAKSCSVISAGNIPAEPFNGSENYAIVDVIKECVVKQPIAHEHGIGNFALCNLVGRLGRSCTKAAVATYVPLTTEGGRMVFLGFPRENKREPDRTVRALKIVQPLAEHLADRSKLAYFERKLEYTERYIREIGHDLASNVQAVFGQLGFMMTGKLSQSAMVAKAREVLTEVRNIYGIAESLDVTLDRSYAIHAKHKIVIADLLKQLCEEYQAEAQEKHLQLNWTVPRPGLWVNADRKSLRLCLVHLLVNAIKYSYDNTTIEIVATWDDSEIRIIVSNRGLPIPHGLEGQMIWEFGYRSKYAKERHVNGSGIGLYTARRIVIAHGGRIWHEHHGSETRFIVAIPC